MVGRSFRGSSSTLGGEVDADMYLASRVLIKHERFCAGVPGWDKGDWGSKSSLCWSPKRVANFPREGSVISGDMKGFTNGIKLLTPGRQCGGICCVRGTASGISNLKLD